MARTASAARTAASPRAPVLPYTKSWLSPASVGYAAVDLSAGRKLVVDFWFKKTLAHVPNQTVVSYTSSGYNTAGGFEIVATAAQRLNLQWTDAGGAQSWTTTTQLTLGRWYHVQAIIDFTAGAKVCKIALNGAVDGTLGTNTATGGGLFANDTLYIANRGLAGGTNVSAMFKDVRLSTFSGTWADADAMLVYLRTKPSTHTTIHQWQGEDAAISPAANSVGATAMTLAGMTFSPDRPSSRRRTAIDMPYSLQMNAGAGRVSMGDVYNKDKTSTFSVSFWIRYTGISSGQLMDKGGGGFDAQGWAIGSLVSGTSVAFAIGLAANTGANVARRYTATPIAIGGDWAHIVFSVDGTGTTAGINAYVNGVHSNGSTTDTLAGNSTLSPGVNMVVGSRTDGAQGFTGNMTRLRMHSRVLTQEEVSNLYCDDTAVAVEGEWLMEDGAGAVLTGTQGAPNGTITTPAWSTNSPSKARSYGTIAEYAAMVAAHGASHYWKMDEPSGNFLPTIGAMNLNVIAVAPTYAVPGKLGNAAYFPVLTTPARMETASEIALAGLQRVVIEAIVNLPNFGAPTYRTLWEALMSSAAAGYFGLFADGGSTGSVARALSYTNGNAGVTYSEVPKLPQQFTHIAQVIDYSQVGIAEVSVYLDGILSMTGTSLIAANTGNLVNTKLAVMCRSGGSLPCPGFIQHLAVYTGANSTLAQIQQRGLYAQRFKALPP